MTTSPSTESDLVAENARLRLRLEEAEAVVEAIRSGIVDAVVVSSSASQRVYTLEGADRPYRLMVEAMQQGIAVLNPQGMVLYCNPCLAELLRISVTESLGGPLDGFVATEDRQLWTELLRNATGPILRLEIRLCRADGVIFPAALALSPLTQQNICLLVTDLRQQKLYEQLLSSESALLDSETRYRRLFETAKDGILILDSQNGRIADANPFMDELLGYPHAHFLGKELWEIGLFSDKAGNEAAVRKVQETGYIRYEHLPLETSHGLSVEVEIVANSYREDTHSVIQFNIRDITERSRLEKRLQEQAAALAELDRRKDEFLAMLGHELRNPLAPITNAVQLLGLQKNASPLQKQAGEIIERQVEQLTRLIDDLLEVSRITTGRIHLQQERVALNGILDRALESARPLLDQRRHEVVVEFSAEPIWLFVDVARLEQVVVNLLNNAAKYTADGGRITLSVRHVGDEAVLRVADTGVGIAPELLPHIFDLFTQSERSLDRSQGGLGIGLCLVQKLVEMHGGRVEVQSTVGQGSEFIVHLPAMPISDPIPTSTSQQVSKPVSTPIKVLVVDDNVDATTSLELLLRGAGHVVRTALDGPTALVAVDKFLPDIVLLDLGLPGIDGYEVAKRIRENPRFGRIVLVAMTGYGQASDKERSRLAGFDHHLVKPVKFRDVLLLLTTVPASTP